MTKETTTKQNALEIEGQIQEAELLQEKSNNHELIAAAENTTASGKEEKNALANQLFGRLQLSGAMTKMLNISTLLDLKKVKEEKLYLNFKGVPVVSPTGEVLIISTWKDFCLSVGLSRQHVDAQLININTFGAEAYEAMTHAGIGISSMRPIRQLPENEFNAVVNEIESSVGDKEAIIELIEGITIKHVKEREKIAEEKQDLQQQVQAAQDKVDANERLLEVKGQRIHELEKVVDKCLTPDEQRKHQLDQEQALKNQLEQVEAECALAIDRLDLIIGQIYNHPKCSDDLEQMPSKLYEYLLKHLVNVADQYQIQFDANQILSPILYNLMDNDAQSGNE